MPGTPFTAAPSRVAFTYMAVAATWILTSDALVLWALPAASQWVYAQTFKGLLFVLVTGVVVHALVRAYGRRMEQHTTELFETRDALARTEARATAGLVAASVAHDVNNLLTVLRFDLDDPDEQALTSARAALDELAGLTQRLQAQGMPARARSQPLDAEVARQLRILRGHPQLRGRSLTAALQPGPVLVDPTLVASIVWNLVLNAGRAGMHVRVETRDRLLVVEDDGPGFAESLGSDPLGAVATTHADGHGLGLVSVRACAHALGAAVAVDTSPTLGGARVTITFR